MDCCYQNCSNLFSFLPSALGFLFQVPNDVRRLLHERGGILQHVRPHPVQRNAREVQLRQGVPQSLRKSQQEGQIMKKFSLRL